MFPTPAVVTSTVAVVLSSSISHYRHMAAHKCSGGLVSHPFVGYPGIRTVSSGFSHSVTLTFVNGLIIVMSICGGNAMVLTVDSNISSNISVYCLIWIFRLLSQAHLLLAHIQTQNERVLLPDILIFKIIPGLYLVYRGRQHHRLSDSTVENTISSVEITVSEVSILFVRNSKANSSLASFC